MKSLRIMSDLCKELDELALNCESTTQESGSEQYWIKERKEEVRNKVWTVLEDGKHLKPYPPSCFDKIPNFRGSNSAAYRLSRLR